MDSNARSRLEDEDLSDLPPLRPSVLTKDRQTLRIDGDLWDLQAAVDGGGKVQIDFRPLRQRATTRFIEIAKRFVVMRARTYSAWSLANITFALSRTVRLLVENMPDGHLVSWRELSIADCQRVLTHGMKSAIGVGGNDFAHVRALYAWGCHGAELPDFDPSIALALQGIRAPGNLKGQRVLAQDPRNGAFVPEEIALITDAIVAGRGDVHDLVIVQLFAELGLRPIQALRCRWAGLSKYEVNIVEEGRPRTLVRYTLAIPRAKDRGEFRTERNRPISTLLGNRLESLRPSNADANLPLLFWIAGDNAPNLLNRALQRWITASKVISPRTGEELKANAYRFRYSIAVEAARDGASRVQIADLLDHVDLQNVEVYIDAAGTVMEQIESKLDAAFGDHIRHFLGRTVPSVESAPFPGLPKRVIPGVFPQLPAAPVLQLGIGACGQDVRAHGLCKLAPPISCYTCPKFAAFRDAPHREIGDSLEAMARDQFGGTADARIGGELVRTIQAIREIQSQIDQEATQ